MKKLLSMLLVLAMLLSLAPAGFAEDIRIVEPVDGTNALVDSGTCGDDLTWTLDDQGLLTISGTGDMWDYNWDNYSPWNVEHNYEIMKVVISDGVTGIGNYAFDNDYSMTEVTIPDSVARIGESAFGSCSDLLSVTIPEGVTSLGVSAFYACYDLAEVKLPTTLTSLGEAAFMSCGALTELSLPTGLTVIGNSAFNSCIGLASLTVPASVSSVGNYAFASCTGLAELRFLGHAPSFGFQAFEYTTTTVYYPADDASWTSDLMQDYGGTVAWTPWTPGAPEGLPIDEANFPDANFRAYVAENLDPDANGYLTDAELAAVEEIEVQGTNIASLKGLEHFTELRVLNFWSDWEQGPLSEVDLSHNTRLVDLTLGFTELTELDMTMLPELRSLMVGFTKLTSIDLTKNGALEQLICSDSDFQALDFSGNPNLRILDCCGNPDLSVIDIRPCASLVADYKAGGRHLEWMKEISQELYDSVIVYGGSGDGGMDDYDYNLAVNTWMTVIAGDETPTDLPAPEYLTVDGERFRLARGLSYGGEELDRRVVVGESGGVYYALDVSGDSVTATALTETEDGLSGSVAVYNCGMELGDGRMIYILMTDEDSGAGALAVGTPADGHRAIWHDYGFGDIIHRQYCCDDVPGTYMPYGDWLWFLTFRDGVFGCSERGNEYSVQFYNFCPENTETYLYIKVCEHEHKTLVEARTADCTHPGLAAYYECPDCGLKLDLNGEIYVKRTGEDDSVSYGLYELGDFYISPALGHDYDPDTGVCTRCGEKAPIYEKVTDISALEGERRYLIVDNETGLALEITRDASEYTDGHYIPADIVSDAIPTVPLSDGRLTVYGTGGATFRLLYDAEDEFGGAAENEANYPALIEGDLSFGEDYSFEFDHPLFSRDLIFARESAGTYMEDGYYNDDGDWVEYDEPIEREEAVVPTWLYIQFLENEDAVIRYFDGMHPIIYDPEIGFRLRDAWITDESWDEETEQWVEFDNPTGVSLYREVLEEPDFATAEIGEVTNYSHYYKTGQYYEGAFVVWKENMTLNGTPIQVYDEDTKTLTDNYSSAELAAMGINVAWINTQTGEPAIIDYDGHNSNYYTGPARVGNYYAVVTQTIGSETREISARVPFEITPTLFTRVTKYEDITTGARWYIYSIMGEIDGQLYAMAMPGPEGTLRAEAIPVTPDENGVVTLGTLRENVFCMRWEPGGHSWSDRRLLQLVTGTGWDVFFGGGNGSIWRGGGWTGDDGFYVDIDEETQAFTAVEPHMGHGAYMLAKDSEGEVFFTRAMWSTGHANPELGDVTEYPVYLYWNQIPEEPISEHSYEFVGTPYDKVYDGEPIPFDPYKNILVDGGKTDWGELEKMGTARVVWREWQGKETVDLEESPVNVGMYQVVIQELRGKDWADVLTETFNITEAGEPHTHVYGEPSWTWRGYSYAMASFTCLDCADDPPHTESLTAAITSETTPATCEEPGETVYTATVEFEGRTYTDVQTETIPASGHDWGEPTYVWAEDNSTVTATRVCLTDESHIETETAQTSYIVVTQPGCETDGMGVYTANFTNEAFDTQRKTVTIPATGHDWGEPSYVWAEDYSTVTATRVCLTDESHVETETAETEYEVITEPTTESEGLGCYTAVFRNPAFVTQIMEVRIPKLPAEGYSITVDLQYVTVNNEQIAWTNLGPNELYNGEVEFTVGSQGDQAVLVAVREGNDYSVLNCVTDEEGAHHFTVTVEKNTEIVLAFKGDINLDGAVKLKDNLMVKKHIARSELITDPLALLTGNVDGSDDGLIRLKDNLMIKKHIAKSQMIGWD